MSTRPLSTRPPRPPTIKDVAQAAGVSLGTASKALNGQGQLRPSTVQRVKGAADALNFRPNSQAQSLHRHETLSIGMISTDSFGRFSMPVMEGIEDVLGSAQRSVFMCNAADDPAREKMHVDALLARRVDGIVVTGRRTDPRAPLDLGPSGLPVVYAYTQVDERASGPAHAAPCLLPDDFGGGEQATRHLLALGRRRIVHLSGPQKFEAARLRARGYRAAVQGAGHAGSVIHGAWSEAHGRETVAQLFGTAAQRAGTAPDALFPDALFCGSDQIARGALEGLLALGLRVPQDVAVIGYDNWDVFAEATRPTLTSIDMNLRDLGRQAGQCLLDLIEGGPGSVPGGPRRLPTQLVVRQSCGARDVPPLGHSP